MDGSVRVGYRLSIRLLEAGGGFEGVGWDGVVVEGEGGVGGWWEWGVGGWEGRG